MADTTINDGADSDTVNTDAPFSSRLPNQIASSSAHKLTRCEEPHILDNGNTKELQDTSVGQDPILAEVGMGMGLQVGNMPPVPLFMSPHRPIGHANMTDTIHPNSNSSALSSPLPIVTDGSTHRSEDITALAYFLAGLQPPSQFRDFPLSQCGSLTSCSTMETTATMSSSSGNRSGTPAPAPVPASPVMAGFASSSQVAESSSSPDFSAIGLHSSPSHRYQSLGPARYAPLSSVMTPCVKPPSRAFVIRPMRHPYPGILLQRCQGWYAMTRSKSRASFSSLVVETGEESLGEVEQHPLYHIKDHIVEVLLGRFHSYRAANQHGAGSGGSGSNGSCGGSHQTSCRDKQTTRQKRKTGDEDGDDVGDDGDTFSRQPKKPKNTNEDAGGRLTLACPFSKRDPARHRGCYRYELKRIRDVKQHLRRCHPRAVYCPSCGDTFQDENIRDAHVRRRTCPEKPDLNVEGVTEARSRRLGRKSSSKKSQEEQWFDVFEILFPGQPRPKSPYVDRFLSDELQSFREFLAQEGPAILSEKVREHGLWEDQHSAFLESILDDGLERIAGMWLQRTLGCHHEPNVLTPEPKPRAPTEVASAPRVICPSPSEEHQPVKPAGAARNGSSSPQGPVLDLLPDLVPVVGPQPWDEATPFGHLSTVTQQSSTANSLFQTPQAIDSFFDLDPVLYNLDPIWSIHETAVPVGGLDHTSDTMSLSCSL